ncbi:MAG TPA: NAD(P)/FAD-dependent oxidoreductase [Planctomycetota bacterium]|nr:NAD(P)/FAD-dependent oxidoreductase [Planctomycetota bacterium]
MTSHYDALILGAGMSGLAAGIRLAHFGLRVCILEKHYMPGGLNSFYRLGKRDFDVGLHAVTNYAPDGDKHLPLNKVLRQLRIKPDEFALAPQRESDIRFPGKRIRFNNDLQFFIDSAAEQFPSQADNFRRLIDAIPPYEKLGTGALPGSARKFLGEYLSDQTLIEMLLCPVMYYGSATPDDMDFEQFCIMFRSLFFEGFARPRIGVRQIVSTLLKKYKANHGELRMKTGVRAFNVAHGRVESVLLDNGETLTADRILSSIGAAETLALCSKSDASAQAQAGVMTFMESISVLDTLPEYLGQTTTITFFNNSDEFRYHPSEELIDPASGVICCPNNYKYDEPLSEGLVRVTNIANYERWHSLPREQYASKKEVCYRRSIEEAVKFMPDFRARVKFIDTFTPLTVRRFTSHFNGAVYGAPQKRPDGKTPFSNLFLCGTDQGFLGIVGAMVSGVAMANVHVLAKGG